MLGQFNDIILMDNETENLNGIEPGKKKDNHIKDKLWKKSQLWNIWEVS